MKIFQIRLSNFDREKCRQNILNNRFDSITCVYHLCLKKYILEGNNSVSDLTSDLFEQFLKTDHLRIHKANRKKKIKLKDLIDKWKYIKLKHKLV